MGEETRGGGRSGFLSYEEAAREKSVGSSVLLFDGVLHLSLGPPGESDG